MPEPDVPTAKALRIFQEIMALQGAPFTPAEFSDHLGIAMPSLYRHLEVLIKSGLLVRIRRSNYLPHPVFLKLLEPYREQEVLRLIVRPILERAAQQCRATLHFGVLEADMVTYIVKVDRLNMGLFTKENMQLEAYCSAIGKVLLATLPRNELDMYLSGFEFPRLTDSTITDPKEIQREIKKTKRRGFGIDNGEIRENLVCIAVPVTLRNGSTIGAVSASHVEADLPAALRKESVSLLKGVSEEIQSLL